MTPSDVGLILGFVIILISPMILCEITDIILDDFHREEGREQ